MIGRQDVNRHVVIGLEPLRTFRSPKRLARPLQRIVTTGGTVDLAIGQLAMVFLLSIADALASVNPDADGGGGVFDDDIYVAHLDRLPLHHPAEIERALLDVVAAAVVVPTSDLVARTAERLGFDGDDPIIGRLIEHVEEQVTDEFGPLVWLSGDRTMDTSTLRDGIVPTHVLDESEKAIGALTVSFDLAGFGGFSRTAHTGMLVCARAVPDGETHQFVGGLFPVAPGTEATLLDLLDEHDPHLVASWVRDLHRPPELRTRENEPVVECEIVATTDDLAGLTDHLDATYDCDTPGQWWTEHHDIGDDESVIRARFHLDGSRLTITANSNERTDRILRRLGGAASVTIVSDTRTRFDPTTVDRTRRAGLPDLRGLRGLDSGPEPAPEEDAVAEIQQHIELRWCREAVPALGGLTPMQAAADPTRREQLERLLASFDAIETPPGAIAMRTDQLRKALGL